MRYNIWRFKIRLADGLLLRVVTVTQRMVLQPVVIILCFNCSFICRLILAAGSEVLYAMLLGLVAEKMPCVRIPDLHPKAFRQMLKYTNLLYTSTLYSVVHNYWQKIDKINVCVLLNANAIFFRYISWLFWDHGKWWKLFALFCRFLYTDEIEQCKGLESREAWLAFRTMECARKYDIPELYFVCRSVIVRLLGDHEECRCQVYDKILIEVCHRMTSCIYCNSELRIPALLKLLFSGFCHRRCRFGGHGLLCYVRTPWLLQFGWNQSRSCASRSALLLTRTEWNYFVRRRSLQSVFGVWWSAVLRSQFCTAYSRSH